MEAKRVAGVTYDDASGTRGIGFDVSVTVSESHNFSLNRLSRRTVTGFWILNQTLAGPSDFYSMHRILNTGGGSNDFCACMFNNGTIYLETQINTNVTPNGGVCPYAINTWYWVSLLYDAALGGSHGLAVFSDQGKLLSQQTKVNNGLTAPADTVALGRSGDAGTPAAFIYTDDYFMDTENGTWPLPPAVYVDQVYLGGLMKLNFH